MPVASSTVAHGQIKITRDPGPLGSTYLVEIGRGRKVKRFRLSEAEARLLLQELSGYLSKRD